MTAIAGIVQRDGSVLIGGDSLSSGVDIAIVNASGGSGTKVFSLSGSRFAVGVTGSCRITQLLRHKFTPPPPSGLAPSFYMIDWVEALRSFAKEHDLLVLKDGRGWLDDCRLLVGVSGHLFEVQADFSLLEAADGYAAIGCAQEIVRGAIHAQIASLVEDEIIPSCRVLERALEAAAHFDIHVRGPFNFATARWTD